MNKFVINTFLGLLLSVSIISCKTETLGPELKLIGSDFDPSKLSFTSEIELRTDFNKTPKIEANWGQESSYHLTITGLTSGAVRKYSGVGDSLELEWEGKSSNIYFFRPGERAKLELNLMGFDSTFVCQDSIYVTKPFKWNREIVNGVKYFLIDGFDGMADIPLNIDGPSPDKNDEDLVFKLSSSISIQGNNSLYLQGTDANNNGWCGDVYHKHLGLLLNKDTSQLDDLPIDSGINPEDLYFNAFIYGTGAKGTTIEFKVYEIDGGDTLQTRADIANWLKAGSIVDELTAYNTSVNDGWIYDVAVTWEGWKLVSVPYSKFRVTNDPELGGSGDGKKESFRISGFNVSILSYPKTGLTTSAYVDFITITEGGRAKYN
jgi:hypothetical protein